MESYRCHRIWVTNTQAKCIVNTVTWFPHNYSMPIVSPQDLVHAALKDLTAALKSEEPSTLVSHLSPTEHEKLAELTKMFSDKGKPNKDPLAPVTP